MLQKSIPVKQVLLCLCVFVCHGVPRTNLGLLENNFSWFLPHFLKLQIERFCQIKSKNF